MADDMGEKTEEPTAKKLADARKKGNVPKSQDLTAAIIMLGVTIIMILLAPLVARSLVLATYINLHPDSTTYDLTVSGLLPAIINTIAHTIVACLPAFAIMAFVGALANVVQIGLNLTGEPLKPNRNKMDPIKGTKKLFSLKSVVKACLDIGKFVAITIVVVLYINGRFDDLAGLSLLPTNAAVALAGRMIVELALLVVLVLIILGVLDFTYQKYQHKKDNKMSKQAVKDERKSPDGDMEMKGRRMRMAREMAGQRLGADVPTADVVVTNPTHYSVALKYDPERDAAPKVVAKGADYIALRIRQIAGTHGIPIVERPPLARALYAQVEPGQQIPLQHFEAVAEILAYVYRLNEKNAQDLTPEPEPAGV